MTTGKIIALAVVTAFYGLLVWARLFFNEFMHYAADMDDAARAAYRAEVVRLTWRDLGYLSFLYLIVAALLVRSMRKR
jgi:hypothetical protein